ncbi:hypothetical protein AOL_s00215g309 [Orbilia oligospora ATCC 24927]|uniref:AB hydrolase-1 domain-containing protein n=1 Tax=Arthrobotrys oligospora (strain ATCC 24927 / CBS 115.81 / DSM 1491) TaxID=756982 RepID=G1XU30_ARTOA|nr:hypothetical protein AOL_s00215g309 [Orbilia oligospora ATCC 24927]EGX43573.1 hypothetical protein AOL_s00215g309 [Orbilia oligospora ATCC 24927]
MASNITRKLSTLLDFSFLIPISLLRASPGTIPNALFQSSPSHPTEGILESILLQNGRTLTYRTYGPPNGTPLFYLHGSPSSSLEAAVLVPHLSSRNIRIIAPNRPGFGQSSQHPNRTLTDHTQDVIAIADSLGIQKFRVIGLSGGGPYSLACAHSIPTERLAGVGVIAGSAPWKLNPTKGMDWHGWMRFHLVRYLSWTFNIAYIRRSFDNKLKSWSVEERRDFWRKDLGNTAIDLGEKDKLVAQDKEAIEEIVDCTMEAFENGCEGPMQDSVLLVADWDFQLGDIRFDGVRLYVGTEDRSTPVHGAREMQKAIKGSKLLEFEGDGHYSILGDRGAEILDDFVKEG